MSLYGPKQLVDSIRTVRKNTIQIAEDIPEKDYGFRPALGSRSVAEILVHIAIAPRTSMKLHGEQRVSTYDGLNFGEFLKQSEVEEKRPRSKAEIIVLLRTGGERWCEWLTTVPEAVFAEQVGMPGGGSKNRFEILLSTKEHEMHHRGQLMVMERMLGIVPHLSRSRQPAREKAAV